ncbi:MAG: hypothetical protein IKL31_11290 [Ruminococcus sp.]|nr:hypothetical protein [Ruminococcus sp.]
MNTLKKATKILSIVDIVLCVLATSLSFLFSVLVDVLHLPWDYLTWVLLILSALALLAIVMFALAVIIRSISSKKIIKEKSVIIAHIVNLAFIALLIYFIYDNDLGFIFC